MPCCKSAMELKTGNQLVHWGLIVKQAAALAKWPLSTGAGTADLSIWQPGWQWNTADLTVIFNESQICLAMPTEAAAGLC